MKRPGLHGHWLLGELGRLPKNFPWDDCRSLFAASPNTVSLLCVAGYSEDDADILLDCAYCDAMVLIKEHLHVDQVLDLTGMAPTEGLCDPALLLKIISRAQGYGEMKYCNMIAMVSASACYLYVTLSMFPSLVLTD